MVVDEYVVWRLPEFPGGQIDGIYNRCAGRVNSFRENTHGVSTFYESGPHLRDIIPDRVVWHQAVCEEADVSWLCHGLRFPPDYCVILRPVEVLIEPLGEFRSGILQL